MAMTNAERQRAFRERRKAAGLRRVYEGKKTTLEHGGICQRLSDVNEVFQDFYRKLERLEYEHNTDYYELSGLKNEVASLLAPFFDDYSRNDARNCGYNRDNAV